MSSDPGVPMGRERLFLVFATLITAVLGTIFSSVLVLAPAPLAVLLYRHGLRSGITAALLSGIVVGVLMQHPIPMILILFMLGLGVALGEAWRDGLSLQQTLIVGWAAAFLAFGAFFYVSRLVFGVDLLDETLKLWIEQLNRIGTTAGGALALSERELAAVSSHLRMVWPGMTAMSSAFVCFVNYWIAGRWLQRLGAKIPWFPPFGHWRFPWYYTWGYIAGVGLPLLPGTLRTSWLLALAANLEMVFRFVFAIQGLAVVWFYLSKWNVRRWVAVTITVLLTLLTPLMVLIGLLDSWFDLRRIDLL
ncbi:MAG: YybS family protein [Limnochordia bacterium]|jgi:uncharacterized protein YybS (DUF2232 family)